MATHWQYYMQASCPSAQAAGNGSVGNGSSEGPEKVVIAGAGIIGCATAYYLSKLGVPATVVEKGEVACASSGKAGGFLALDWNDGGPVGPLARLSYSLHKTLASELGQDTGYREVRTFSVAASAKPGELFKYHTAATLKFGRLQNLPKAFAHEGVGPSMVVACGEMFFIPVWMHCSVMISEHCCCILLNRCIFLQSGRKHPWERMASPLGSTGMCSRSRCALACLSARATALISAASVQQGHSTLSCSPLELAQGSASHTLRGLRWMHISNVCNELPKQLDTPSSSRRWQQRAPQPRCTRRS